LLGQITFAGKNAQFIVISPSAMMPDFLVKRQPANDEHRLVVGLRSVLASRALQAERDLFQRLGAGFPEGVLQRLQAQFRRISVKDFGEAVRQKHQNITWGTLNLRGLEYRLGKKAYLRRRPRSRTIGFPRG
jgi:hypothetical protein